VIAFGDSRLPRRFWKKVRAAESGCWEWTGSQDRKGYGWYSHSGQARRAHRVAHEVLVGPVGDGLQVLHSCDNPPCINPAHLRAGTPAQNSAEMVERGRAKNQNTEKTHCDNGHEFTAENTYRPPGRVGRHCRTCNAEASRRYKRRNIGRLATVALPQLTVGGEA
jgi:hypothetical protein